MRSAIGNSASDPVFVTSVTGSGGSAATSGTAANPTVVTNGGSATGVSRLLSSAATTNATVAKASGGTVYRVDGYNSNAAARYLKLYNKATAPTVGTDVPVYTRYLAPQASFAMDLAFGLAFPAGISFALTVNAADADTTAIGAGDILAMNLVYA